MQETYRQMVTRLFKDMGSDAATMIHACVGITGEIGELFNTTGRENTIEELGDFRFYAERLAMRLGVVIEMIHWAPESWTIIGYDDPIHCLLIHATDVQDLVKKYWVYNKPFEQVQNELTKSFRAMCSAYHAYCEEQGTDDEAVKAANQYKLSTGPKARYPLGYSDAAAQARADKV